jgi:predicted house-cleaning NTP pyrophosphatase (Maf/HAM1 superfamily)
VSTPGALAALIRRALPFAVSGIVANVQTRIAPLMLGYLSMPAELGLFAAASRFGSVARLAPQAVFAGALPVLSHEHGRDRASAERAFQIFDTVLLGASAALAAGCALFAAPVLRLIYGASFTPAAPALLWVGVGLIPLLSNSGRKVFLYASGGESVVVRWSAIGLLLQGCAGVALIPAFGSAGAAVSVAVGEAIIWWPLRHATTQPTATINAGSSVVSGFPPPPEATARLAEARFGREGGSRTGEGPPKGGRYRVSDGPPERGHDQQVILGADTTVVVDGEILGKPRNDEDGRDMLRRLSGRAHQVMTGVSLRQGAFEVGRVETSSVVVRALTDEDISWDVASGEGRDKAGGYAIQGLASRFIPSISGSYSNVVGLPVTAVDELMRSLLASGR